MSIGIVSLSCLASVTMFISIDSVVTFGIEAFSFGMQLLWVLPLAHTRPFVASSLSDIKIRLPIAFRFSSFVRSFGWTGFHAVLSFNCFTSLCAPSLPFFLFFNSFLRLRACANQWFLLSFFFLLSIFLLSIWHMAIDKNLPSFTLPFLLLQINFIAVF